MAQFKHGKWILWMRGPVFRFESWRPAVRHSEITLCRRGTVEERRERSKLVLENVDQSSPNTKPNWISISIILTKLRSEEELEIS